MGVAKDEYFSRLRRLFLRLAFFSARFAIAARPDMRSRAVVLAVCFASGVAVYFALSVEPPLWVGFLGAVGAGGGAVYAVRGGKSWAGTAAFAAVAVLGFAVAQAHTLRVSAPVWERQSTVRLSGTIEDVEERERDRRLILSKLQIDGTAAAETPARVRLSVRRGAEEDENIFAVGQRVALRAGLMPPPVPSIPGGYDFQRAAWFERLGAVGYSIGPIAALGREEGNSLWERATDTVERMRLWIGARLRDGIGGGEGAVAAALVTGEMGAIPEDTVAVYRASGLAHMLSISGLHFSLAAATVLVVLRGGMALIPPVALQWDIKKVSAILALLMMTVYLVISGVSIPAQRAYVMGAVMVAAIVVDRSALSLHVLGVSALIVLALRPDALLSPSFQMSYAAVLVLIVTFDVWGPRWSRWRGQARGPVSASLRAAVIYAVGVVVSTSVAGLATAPFSIFHFQTYSVYGVLANMAAIPVVAVCVMPGLLLAVLLMPMGAEWITFPVLRWSLWGVEQVAAWVAGLPGAVITLPPLTMPQLLGAVAGFLVLCLWSGWGRWFGGAIMAAAFATSVATSQIPLVVLHGDGVLRAVRSGDGLVLSPGRANGFARDAWLRRWGQGAGQWQEGGLIGTGDGIGDGTGDGTGGETGQARMNCDRLGCLYIPPGFEQPFIALARTEAAVAEDCGVVAVMVSSVALPPWSALRQKCAKTPIIDGWTLRRFGTHVLYLDPPDQPGGPPQVRVETVAAAQGERPWSLLGQERARRDRAATERQQKRSAREDEAEKDESRAGTETQTGDETQAEGRGDLPSPPPPRIAP